MTKEKTGTFKTINIPYALYVKILKIKSEIERKLGYSVKTYSIVQKAIDLLEKKLMNEDK